LKKLNAEVMGFKSVAEYKTAPLIGYFNIVSVAALLVLVELI
jgi:hypothetical protein